MRRKPLLKILFSVVLLLCSGPAFSKPVSGSFVIANIPLVDDVMNVTADSTANIRVFWKFSTLLDQPVYICSAVWQINNRNSISGGYWEDINHNKHRFGRIPAKIVRKIGLYDVKVTAKMPGINGPSKTFACDLGILKAPVPYSIKT